MQEVADLLLEDGSTSTQIRPVSRDEFPGATQGSAPMVVCSISGLRNVNAIDDDQKIEFASGMNVVYGRNGSGKTGYSRVLKHAGRTLHRESVLTNVQSEDAGPPSAIVTIKTDVAKEPFELNLEAPGPAELGRICVADADACEVYLTSDTEVDYVPASLHSLRRFAVGLKALDAELDRRRQLAAPTPLDLRVFGATSVADSLEKLEENTSDAEILTLATLSKEELARKAELTEQRGAIQASQAPKLRASAVADANAAQALLDELRNLHTLLGTEQIQALSRELQDLKDLEAASTEAAKQFSEEPLKEIGSNAWRKLWEAAEHYADHLEQKFPEGHPATCPLCMQALAPEAQERLVRFDEFVRNDVNARLESRKKALQERIAGIPEPDAIAARHGHAIELLGQDEGQGEAQVRAWVSEAKEVVEGIQSRSPADLGAIAPLPDVFDNWISDRRSKAEKYAKLERAEDQKAVLTELAELEARQLLQERKKEVIDYLEGLRLVAKIDAAKSKLGRTAVSRKMTDLSRDLVEANVQDALNRQLAALDFRGLEVVAKSKSPEGKPKLGLKFKTVDKVPLTAVLSKGEQRRLSLAIFLAELEVMADSSPIVFDDPVSSIDQEGRRHIARALLGLARRRQVIIFTHELSFIYELDRWASDDVPILAQQLNRRGRTVGHVSPGLPWQGLKSKQRVAPLHERLAAARQLDEAGNEEEYEVAAKEFCTLLREAFERAVEDGVFADVVTRRMDSVHVLGLKNVRWNEEICDLVERGTNESSPWVHDQARGDGVAPPRPDELAEGLEVFKALLAAIKNFDPRHKGNDPPRPRLKAVQDDLPEPEVEQLRIVENPPAVSKDV